jgi:antitoxin component YwqK of YwqJK toxin-antitoxin module
MMNWIKVLCGSVLLAGCSSNLETEALQTEIYDLKTRSSTELEILKAEIRDLKNRGEGVFEGKKLQSRNGVAYFARQMNPFTGVATWELENLEKKESIYRDGKKQGMETWWYDNGEKKFEGSYMGGKPNGRFTRFYRNGKKSYERIFRDQELVAAIAWEPNGDKCPDTKYVKGNGKLCQYHENGKKESEITFRDGKKIAQKKWDVDGNLLKE